VTLEELERSLPNGLHDADLVSVHVDYRTLEAALVVGVDISESEGKEGDVGPTYRYARLVFFGLQFIVVDPPDVQDGKIGPSLMEAGTGQPRTAPAKTPRLSDDSFLCWFFLSESNSFIRIAARNVALEWLDTA
jgi:hypothetical protein